MRTSLLIATLAFLFLQRASAQPAANTDQTTSQQKALAALERSMAAHGGKQRLLAARSIDLRASLLNSSVHQSPSPAPPFSTWSSEVRYAMDAARERWLFEADNHFANFRSHSRTVSAEGKGYRIDLLAETVNAEDDLQNASPLLHKILPHKLLLEAEARRASLRWVGTSTEGGRQLEAISYVRPGGELFTLYVDARTSLVARAEALREDSIDGDVTFSHEYGSYRRQDGIAIPFSFEVRRGPWLITEGKVRSIEIGKPLRDAEFAIPENYRSLASYDPEMQFDTVAPNVHVIRYVPGGYNVLCVEFSDYTVVVETPESDTPSGVSERVISLIQQKVPGKPIRYAVPTHHHSDHVGGIRAYIAAGAVILITQGNEAFLRRLAEKKFTILPDALTKNPAVARLEFIPDSGRILKDASQELHLYKIGPIPHVNEMVIAYLPRQRLLFQTDLFNAWACLTKPVPNEDIGHPTALANTQGLLAAIEKLGLNVDTVFGGHGREVPYQWLKEHTQRRASDGRPMWACTAEELR